MKQVIVIMMLFVFVFLSVGYCQKPGNGGQTESSSGVVTRLIYVSSNKTTVILFPYSVLPVDVGSDGILAEKVDSVKNILKVKAAYKDFEPTNLTAITSDGVTYSFHIQYCESPESYVIDLRQPVYESRKPVMFSDGMINEQALNTDLDSIMAADSYLSRPRASFDNVSMQLSGIYYNKGILYMAVLVKNESPLPYVIDFTRSTLKDEKTVKRSALQVIELTPFITRNEHNTIWPGGENLLVLAYTQFGIAHNQRFHFEIFEKNGARHLSMQIKSKKLLKVHSL